MRISDWSSDVCSSDLRAILTPDVYSQRRKELQDSAASLQQRARAMRQGIDRGFSETMQKIQLVLFGEVGKLAQDRGGTSGCRARRSSSRAIPKTSPRRHSPTSMHDCPRGDFFSIAKR